jgi:hypothetical protein
MYICTHNIGLLIKSVAVGKGTEKDVGHIGGSDQTRI